jgi:hypothetical protein
LQPPFFFENPAFASRSPAFNALLKQRLLLHFRLCFFGCAARSPFAPGSNGFPAASNRPTVCGPKRIDTARLCKAMVDLPRAKARSFPQNSCKQEC